jgi:heme-degrading monooxygenase HmoA
MYARIVEFVPKPENEEEIINVVRKEILPILKRQPGFLEFLPFVPENGTDNVIAVTLWAEKHEADRYEREVFPKVEAILKPYLTTPVAFKHYNVETSLCQHFAEALWSEV